MHYNMWVEIVHQFSNVNGETVEVWEWMSNFTPHIIRQAITYARWDLCKSILVKGLLVYLSKSATSVDVPGHCPVGLASPGTSPTLRGRSCFRFRSSNGAPGDDILVEEIDDLHVTC